VLTARAHNRCVGEVLPVLEREDDAKVRHRHVVAVDGVACRGLRLGRQVGDDLVAVEVEVDPLVGAAPFGAADRAAPERARGGKIVDREGEVERAQGHGEAVHFLCGEERILPFSSP
jgi:hypothetical protein